MLTQQADHASYAGNAIEAADRVLPQPADHARRTSDTPAATKGGDR